MNITKQKFKPIGIFDSGVGGLSVAQSIRKELINENILYVADSLNAPYGDKSELFIFQRSKKIIDFLLSKNAKAIVVACNTATVSVISKLREHYSIPIFGIEPGIKPAISTSRNGIIGVIATEQTLNSRSFNDLRTRLAQGVDIIVQPCPGLVELIEKFELHGIETKNLLEKFLIPLLNKGIDTLVLGCTHYSFITPLITKTVGPNVKIINTNHAVAKEVSRRLRQEKLASSLTTAGGESFWSSEVRHGVDQLFSELWGKPVVVEKLGLQ